MTGSDPRLFDGIGLWLESLTATDWSGSPALFLDRDGVLIEERNYVGSAGDVALAPGAADLVGWANGLAVPVAVITNQSGIGRGYYDWTGFAAVQDEMRRQLRREHAHIDLVAACAFHADAKPPLAVADHPWRKPAPGMLTAIAQKAGICLSRSVMIGDRWSDIEAANTAGLPWGILLQTGHGKVETTRPAPAFERPMRVDIAPDLAAAAELLRDAGWPAGAIPSPQDGS